MLYLYLRVDVKHLLLAFIFPSFPIILFVKFKTNFASFFHRFRSKPEREKNRSLPARHDVSHRDLRTERRIEQSLLRLFVGCLCLPHPPPILPFLTDAYFTDWPVRCFLLGFDFKWKKRCIGLSQFSSYLHSRY